MAVKTVVIFKLGELSATAAGAVNITRVKLNDKQVVGTLQLTDKGVGANATLGMCVDKSGNIYLSDYDDHVILKVTEGGKINHIAGSSGVSGNNAALQNVTGTAARFYNPRGIACDNSGNLYVADRNNNQIRIIRDGKVGVFAGNGLASAAGGEGLVDASSNPLQSKFKDPFDVAVDNSGNVFVADTGNYAIRKIYGGKVLNICGGHVGATTGLENVKACNVAGANGFFKNPCSVACDAAGNLFVADNNYKKIYKITPKGWFYLFSGAGTSGHALGTGTKPAYTCTYGSPDFIRCDRNGNVYVIDSLASNQRLVKLNTFGVPSSIIEFNEAGSDVNAGIRGLAVSPAGKVFVAIVKS